MKYLVEVPPRDSPRWNRREIVLEVHDARGQCSRQVLECDPTLELNLPADVPHKSLQATLDAPFFTVTLLEHSRTGSGQRVRELVPIPVEE